MTFQPLNRKHAIILMLVILTGSVAIGAENYTARAELRTADGQLLTASVAISLEEMLKTGERDTLIEAFQSDGNETFRKALAALGYVEGEQTRVPIKYAFPRATAGGRIVTIVCSEPVVHIGGDMPDAKPGAGFDYAFILLILDSNGSGTGEISPAAKLKLRGDGALVTEGYGAQTIWLSEVARK